MVALNQVFTGFQQGVALFFRRIAAFFSFLAMRLKNFKALSIQEQIAFGLIGIGLVFIATSVVMFLV